MAHGAMTLAEPHVQQARCDPTQGDESSTLVDRHPHGTCGVRHGAFALQRDWLYARVMVIVLSVLVYSLLGGHP
jgi:hypothetical protein